jgi:cellulose biosynthesis protein BcsQ
MTAAQKPDQLHRVLPDQPTAQAAADLVLIPCRPSLVDLDAIRRTAQLIHLVSDPDCWVILRARW